MLAPSGALDVAMEPALGGQAGPVWEERPGQLLASPAAAAALVSGCCLASRAAHLVHFSDLFKSESHRTFLSLVLKYDLVINGLWNPLGGAIRGMFLPAVRI